MSVENEYATKEELHNAIKQAMMRDGAIPKEIIEYDEMIKEKKEMEEMQKKAKSFVDKTSDTKTIFEAFAKKYPSVTAFFTRIAVVVKVAGVPFKIEDYVIEYQINQEEGVIIKIGGEVIGNIIVRAGISIAVAISAVVAGFFVSTFGATIVGFVVFALGVILTIWVANKSQDISSLIYKYIFVPAQQQIKEFKNGVVYCLKDWYEKFTALLVFSNPEGKKIFEYNLTNKYDNMSDDEINLKILNDITNRNK